MKKIVYIVLLCLILTFSSWVKGLALENNTTAKSEEDSLQAQRTWDFGRIKAGEPGKHEFIFKNNSERILTITGVNTSCGCTVSDTDKKILQPSEETLIKVNFDSSGYLGQVSQYVYVNTDSRKEPVIRFTIKADVFK